MLRIIAGKFRSRLIEAPNSDKTRPTKDMAKGGMFSSIGPDILNARVLDLFAGSGSLGIEALSRGAKSATFVDNDRVAVNIIMKNLRSLGLNEEIKLCDYEDALSNMEEDSFDIVFLDPPYLKDVYRDIIYILINKNIISKNGIIVAETNHEIDFEGYGFSKIKLLKYGYSLVYVLRR